MQVHHLIAFININSRVQWFVGKQNHNYCVFELEFVGLAGEYTIQKF